ncbi:kinase-like domain-containing protein [Aspergillus carlsbadensis]|nr:kinase-like domain-containing protein [Aspergillus carlsbadensis]
MDTESAKGVHPTNKITILADTTLTVQYQLGLGLIGVGAAGQVYGVDDDIVLKACRIYVPPSSAASAHVLYDYASESIFHCGISKDEKVVNRLLSQHPHPNITEAIDTNYPEGIYFRRYQPFPKTGLPAQPGRIRWYQDILQALAHIHSLRLTHSDLRMDNILLDAQGRALLADFGASAPFGSPNPSLPVLLNGPAETVSHATDAFAMASLIYEVEIGARQEISLDDCKELILPVVLTGHAGLDALVGKGWCGEYASTEEMLADAQRLGDGLDTRGRVVPSSSREELQARISQWRETRQEQHGCILYSLPTEAQLQALAERYGWDVDAERHFKDDQWETEL